MCDDWKNSFISFYKWALISGYKDNLTIERIDNNGNYEPKNCKWATKTEQNRNKRNVLFLTYKGKSLCVAQWAKKLGIKAVTLRARIRKGWSVNKVLEYK